MPEYSGILDKKCFQDGYGRFIAAEEFDRALLTRIRSEQTGEEKSIPGHGCHGEHFDCWNTA